MRELEKVSVHFFQVLNDANQITAYGYKQRANASTGYNVISFPYGAIASVEYPDSKSNVKNRRDKFKKYILMNLSEGVWPELEKSLDSIMDSMDKSAYVKAYVASYANDFEMKEIERYFKENISGHIMLSGHNNAFVETSKREKGFYAWLVVGDRSWTLINPRVGVFGRG
jgi:hypothetical protein